MRSARHPQIHHGEILHVDRCPANDRGHRLNLGHLLPGDMQDEVELVDP